LNNRGFASAQFITRDAVCVCREEIKRIAPLYTDGEIWLGKKDAGAQIAVKSVRGDRVFWMDQPTVNGGNFSAMREMLRAIDSLVLDHMSRLGTLRGSGTSRTGRTRCWRSTPGVRVGS
jgi:hypoxia-inducible factor (prolyl hydroxylase)